MKRLWTKGPWSRTYGQRFRHNQSAGIAGPDGIYIIEVLDNNRAEEDEEVEATALAVAELPGLLEATETALLILAAEVASGSSRRLRVAYLALADSYSRATGFSVLDLQLEQEQKEMKP
jgi:hypothetical protein